MNQNVPPVSSLLVVLCTCPPARAEEIATALVEQRLAACVNIGGPVRSIYRWQGKVEKEEEELLIIKTTPRRWPGLRDTLARLHPYDVPEIIALPVTDGHPDYLRWAEESLCTE